MISSPSRKAWWPNAKQGRLVGRLALPKVQASPALTHSPTYLFLSVYLYDRGLLRWAALFLGELRDGLTMINMQSAFLIVSKGYQEKQVGILFFGTSKCRFAQLLARVGQTSVFVFRVLT
jgi:hypothetical protein